MYNVQLIVNGETIDIKRLDNATIDKLVKQFEKLGGK